MRLLPSIKLSRLFRSIFLNSGLIGLIISWSLMIAPVLAQGGYPQPNETHVNDYADILTDQDVQQLQTLLDQLQQEDGIEAIVVTINSIHDYPVNQATIESFATALFNTWGIGDSKTNKGVLILVAVTDRKVRIELGRGYGSQYNSAMQEVINEHILPAFRQNDYSRGLYRGTRAMIAKLTGSWPAETSLAVSNVPIIRISLIGLLGGVTAVGLVGYGLYHYLGARQWRCPSCKTAMVRVPEAEVPSYLDTGQIKEQELYTMRYEVWRCPTCGSHSTKGSQLRQVSFEMCPQCHYRTTLNATHVVEEATYHSSGSKRIEQTCYHCNYTHASIAHIPMLVETTSYNNDSSYSSSSYDSGSSWSSSDSGSSWSSSDSGGSSSGDGASGSW
jgi:uncharacterized protein